ncbi:MAG: TIM barrel protein [Actinomycetales bacterium]
MNGSVKKASVAQVGPSVVAATTLPDPDRTARSVGLAPLSMLGLEPWLLVQAAAGAGFSFVGLRVRAVTADEPFHDLAAAGRNARLTLRALQSTGLQVRDIEFLMLDGHVGPQDWEPMLEAGAGLGARTLTVAASDPDRSRLVDTLTRLTADAAGYGIVPTLEAIAYQEVRTLPEASQLAAAAGCGVLPDALHYLRVGATPEDARTAAGLTPLVQLCDAPAAAPEDRAGLLHESRAERALPGHGACDLKGLLGAFDDGTPISVEVPNPRLAEIGPFDYAHELMRATQEVLALGQDIGCQTPTGQRCPSGQHEAS